MNRSDHSDTSDTAGSPRATVASLSDVRTFSLERVEIVELASGDDLCAELICFEAGQRLDERTLEGDCLYRVEEGEAIVRSEAFEGGRRRLGKGRVLLLAGGTPHELENAGGGLLVVSAVHRV